MTDYKELIEMLRRYSQDLVAYKLGCAFADAVDAAADAIEQLVKERDEWKTLGSLANKRAEDYREMRRQRDKAIKERDAAIADLKINWLCAVCKNRVVTKEWMACKNKDFYEAPCGAPTCLNFEWRGVQEDNDEID